MILSVPSLLESFEDPDDGFHVGIHEFAHLLDASHSQFDGIPVGLDTGAAREWLEIAEKEMERLRRAKSVLDDYGEHDPVEFLAVAVEGSSRCRSPSASATASCTRSSSPTSARTPRPGTTRGASRSRAVNVAAKAAPGP